MSLSVRVNGGVHACMCTYLLALFRACFLIMLPRVTSKQADVDQSRTELDCDTAMAVWETRKSSQ